MSDDDNPQVHFIISAPRSGSTWLANALNQHPQVLATENRFFGQFCELWKNRNGHVSPRITADKYFQGIAQHSFWRDLNFESATEMSDSLLHEWIDFLTNFLAKRSGKSIVVDKITPYIGTSRLVISGIRKYFPDATIVQLIRDGRDVATSGVFDWLGRQPTETCSEQSHKRDQFFLDPHPGATLDRFFDDESLETWSRYWTEPFKALSMDSTQLAVPSAPAITVRYEEMLIDQPKCLEKLFGDFKIDNTAGLASSCAKATSFEQTTGRAAGDAAPLSKSRRGIAGDWRNYFTQHDARLFWDLAGDILLATGYANDSTWVDACPQRLSLAKPAPGIE